MRPPYGELTKRQRMLVNHELGYNQPSRFTVWRLFYFAPTLK
jgi:hypothetical protein